MKIQKIVFLISLAIVVSVLGGIVFGDDSGDAAAYFPMKPGNYWVYKLSMPGSSQVYQRKFKIVDPTNGKNGAILYDPKGNPEVFVYYEQNQQGLFKTSEMSPVGLNQYKPLWPVLKSKMAVGTSWSWESDDHKMKENTKVIGIEKVTVPAGTFEALIIECYGTGLEGVAYTDKTWWVKNVGYVKDELTIQGKSLISELTEYQLY